MYAHTFEDKSQSFNAVSVTPILVFEIEFNGLTATEASIFDAHYDLANGQLHSFPFTDKSGDLHTGVRYANDGYKRNHDGHKSWIQSRKIKLVKRP